MTKDLLRSALLTKPTNLKFTASLMNREVFRCQISHVDVVGFLKELEEEGYVKREGIFWVYKGPVGITLERLQEIVLRLSNSCWVRWYAHWNYPEQYPWEIAFSCIDITRRPIELYEPDLPRGWRKEKEHDWFVTYIWQRIKVGGEPYKGAE